MLNSLAQSTGLIRYATHRAAVDELHDRIRKLETRNSLLEAAAADTDRVVARLTQQEKHAQDRIIMIRAEVIRAEMDHEDTQRELSRVREQLLIRESELRALQSVPTWTRNGRKWVKITAGESPLQPGDTLLAEIAHRVASALADELYVRAVNLDPGARALVARAAPHIEHQPEPKGTDHADVSGRADGDPALPRRAQQQPA